MLKLSTKTWLLLPVTLFAAACSAPPPTTGPSTPQPQAAKPAAAAGDLKFQAPQGWVTEQASSSMRVAQYKLPRAEGDPEDGELVLYYFGPGQGGSVEANLERWVGQMQQPDGTPSKDKSHTETLTVNGLKVSLLDVTGTYTAEMAPGSGTRHNSTGYRMRAAVIETPKGPYFVKLVGPEKTIGKWENEFKSYIESFSFK